jgi:hypothetical protein
MMMVNGSLKPLVFEYFSNLFTSDQVQFTDPVFIEKVQPKVSQAINEFFGPLFCGGRQEKQCSALATLKPRDRTASMRFSINAFEMTFVLKKLLMKSWRH